MASYKVASSSVAFLISSSMMAFGAALSAINCMYCSEFALSLGGFDRCIGCRDM